LEAKRRTISWLEQQVDAAQQEALKKEQLAAAAAAVGKADLAQQLAQAQGEARLHESRLKQLQEEMAAARMRHTEEMKVRKMGLVVGGEKHFEITYTGVAKLASTWVGAGLKR
jgi:hypothetical protein